MDGLEKSWIHDHLLMPMLTWFYKQGTAMTYIAGVPVSMLFVIFMVGCFVEATLRLWFYRG